ncbi:hypothetical protein F5Y12DRAFT_718807 [Xylaria sp. FL1777]|nr:hypothetical protein F5Y12DRAFT_718807 [Xylaria sp. FL1777]
MRTKTVYLLMLVDLGGCATASFHNSFSDIRRNTDLLLEWDRVNATDYPLVIHVRALNITSDHKVNTFETDISSESGIADEGSRVIDNSTAGLTDNSFLWRGLPSPLPFLSTATYDLQILCQPQVGDTTSELVIASSTPFAILPEEGDGDDSGGWQTTINGTASDPPESENSSHSDGRPNSSTAIAAGLVVPLVVGISVFVFLRVRKRRKRTLEERRKERATLVID